MKIDKNKLASLKFDEAGLIPAIIQDEVTGQVLMLAYMNKTSLMKTLQSGETCFYSRHRQKLWKKGETSGNTQKVKAIFLDCDNDTLLVQVEQKGVACHTGHYSCFFRNLQSKQIDSTEPEHKTSFFRNIFSVLQEIMEDRKNNPRKDSYVCQLMADPGEKIPKKIGEEATEVVIALKDQDKEQIIYETADLWFHTLVALSYHNISYQRIFAELARRRK